MTHKILLADDESGIRKVLGITLADMGYEVLTAENGEDALSIFAAQRPAIVLTDIKMPTIDGIELLRRIKQQAPDTEVIMISGHGDMDLAIKSLKLEATDFITKPINNDVLEIALKRALEKIEMRRQLREYTENLETLVAQKSAKLVALERMVAVNQAVEGISSALSSLAGDLEGGLGYFNEMPCYVALYNPNREIVAVNRLYAERLGERLGCRAEDIYSQDSAVELTFRSGRGQQRRETITYRDKHRGPVIVHTAPIRDKDGNIELVVEISADITEVKRLQEELKATQQRYQQLFDSVPCFISVLDRDLRIFAANRLFKEHFAPTPGDYCHEITTDQDRRCPECPVARTFEDGRSHRSEMKYTARNGARYNVLIQTAPIRNASGEIEQVMEMATDVTLMRRLEDNLSTLGLMVGTISHSIKGVLTGLDAGLYFLESGLDQKEQGRVDEGLEVVKLMVDRIRNVVLNILYYTKERELQSEETDVGAFLEDLMTMIAPKVKGRAIGLECDVDASADRFEVDPVMVRTALLNILENAVDACLEDSSRPRHRICVRARSADGTIVIEIEDDGVGMTPTETDQLFSLFFSSKGHSGTGLGLFIANKIVQQHGGSIEVASTAGSGTCFRIQIPKKLSPGVKGAAYLDRPTADE